MELALTLFGVSVVADVLLWWRNLWRFRLILGVLSAITIMAGTVAFYLTGQPLLATFIALLSGYRLLNIYRGLKGRSHKHYLLNMGRRAAFWLIVAQAAVFLIGVWLSGLSLNGFAWLYALTAVQIIGGIVLLLSTLRHARTTRPVAETNNIVDRDLPTVSVAVPARNETVELEACIKSLLSSDYPKLEILVLDDCSQNTRTPEVIKKFAQQGVRFLAGKKPPESWLAKNFAYDQLADSASGELLLFCGVDTRFSSGAIRQLVLTLLSKDKDMISVMPRNHMTDGLQLLLQPARYAWEISLPRRIFNRPPVLSTCWLIYKSVLLQAGGLESVKRSVVPEAHFANYTATHNDGYSFIRSTAIAEITSDKSAEDQQSTAIRTRYPQLHRRLELIPLVATIEAILLVLPFSITIAAFTVGITQLGLASLGAYILQAATYLLVAKMTYGIWLARGFALVPFVALYDIALLHYSMWKYECGEIIWKERNVCLPVMHVIPHLPKLD